jgi:uncharacterized protein YacL
MILYVLRALFILLMAAVGWFYLSRPDQVGRAWVAEPIAVALAVFFVTIDIFAPRRKLAVFAGSFFGLCVGIAIAYALSFAVGLLVDQYVMLSPQHVKVGAINEFADLIVGIICCYLAISFVLQTKDDFRFIIPYVEFSKQTKGSRPVLLDSSVLIDGRIAEVAETGLLESQLVVPHFILDELQAVADSADRLKRNRGRRGLDMLAALRESRKVDVALYESPREEQGTADQRLLHLARNLNARVLTNDYNLNKVAQLTGVDVINLNDLANALRPVAVPGDPMRVQIVKPGEESGQGVGYLNDGTMVVVEHARPHIGEEIDFLVTRALQTSAGRMIFGRLANDTPPPKAPPAPSAPSDATPQPARSNPRSNPHSTAR